MKNKKYKLIGVLNEFMAIPGGIHPIFKDETDNLYFGICYDENFELHNCFTAFIPLYSGYSESVRSLSDCKATIEIEQDSYDIGDSPVFAYQYGDNEIYIGQVDKYVEFLKNFRQQIQSSKEYRFKNYLLEVLKDDIKDCNEIIAKTKIHEEPAKEIKKVKEQE